MHTVLIVDDEPAIRVLVKTILENAGFKVLQAPCASDALAILGTDSVEALLTDLEMPGKTGAELIREAKLKKPGLACCYMTGSYASLPGFAGLDGVPGLGKPFTSNALVETVKNALQSTRRTAGSVGSRQAKPPLWEA